MAAPAQPAAASAYGQPVPFAPAPVARKTSPIVWVLVVILGIVVLGGIGVVGAIGFIAHRVHQAGVSFDHGRNGGFTMQARGADGKDATVEFGGSAGKLPSWVPVYPGSAGRTNFAVRGSGDGGAEGGDFTFTTSDDASKVKSFYAGKCKEMGLTINLDSTTEEGGIMVAADEGGDRRSLTITVGGHPSETTVNVIYGRK